MAEVTLDKFITDGSTPTATDEKPTVMGFEEFMGQKPQAPTIPPPQQSSSVAINILKGLPEFSLDVLKEAGKETAAAAAYEGAGAIKGATLGYVDPTKFLDDTALGNTGISKPIAGFAGQFAGALAPISVLSKAVGVGLQTAGILNDIHPVLQGLVHAGITGAIFGGAEKPEEETLAKRAHNALDNAAGFIVFTGAGQLLDEAANAFGIGKTARYNALRDDIIDIFVKKGANEEQAAAMADTGLQEAIKQGGGWSKVTASDLGKARNAVRAGEKIVLDTSTPPEEVVPPKENLPAVPETGVPEEAPKGTEIPPAGSTDIKKTETPLAAPNEPPAAEITHPMDMNELTKNTISEFRVGQEDAQGLDINKLIVEGKPQRDIYDRAKALADAANAPHFEAKAIKEQIINEIGKFNLEGNKDIAEEIKSLPEDFRAKKGEGVPFDVFAQGVAEKFLGPNADKNDVMDFLKTLDTKRQHINSFIGDAQQQVLSEMQGQLFDRVQPGIKKAIRERTGQIKPPEEATITESVALRARLAAEEQAAKQGFRAGKEAGIESVKSVKQILDRRRGLLRSIRDSYHLNDNDLRKVGGKDIRLMSNYEFKQYIDDVEAKAAVIQKTRDAKLNVLSTLHEMEFKKVDNLRQYLKLPSIDKMTVEELNGFNQALEGFQKGDEFLSVRKLETVDNTELQGIKTVREAKEKLASKLGVPVEEVQNIKVSALDKFRYDTALARRNPFYQHLVDETNGALLDAEQRFLQIEKEIDPLVKAARGSRPRGLIDQAIPTDKNVFDYLSSDEAGKKALAENMTDPELDLANYMQARFAQFRDYLVQEGVLEKYQDNYITHIRRGFLENWKDDGLVDAFKNVFKQYQEDQAVFTILDDDTQNVLPLEKFFQFAMHRSGELKPSQNVSKAFKAYTKALYKKQALDKIVPALDIYANSLVPKVLTDRGLEMDRRLVKFVHEFVNNKKGRRSSLGGILPQGGAVDLGLRAIDAVVTLIDLGLNVPVSATVAIGENVTTFANLGSKQYSRGIARWSTEKGKDIIEANRSLIGKDPWSDLSNTADDIGDKFHKGLFFLFAKASETSNKIHLLGSLTDAEWSAREITSERRAEISREIGRFRTVPGARSIIGSTSAGKTLTKYKNWAIPVLHTVIDDISKVSSMAASGDPEIFKSREFQELFRGTILTSLIVLAGKGLSDAHHEDTFTGKVLGKAYRESLTLLGAIDPTVFTTVRALGFLNDLASSLKLIVKLEKYKHKEGYKGVQKLISTFTPRAVKTFSSGKNKKAVL